MLKLCVFSNNPINESFIDNIINIYFQVLLKDKLYK